MSDLKKPFCHAPWIHSHCDADGSRRLCCYSKPLKIPKNSDFDTFWNGEEMREVRKKMLEGKAPEDLCQACLNCPTSSDLPLKNFMRPDDEVRVLLDHTDTDGKFHQLPNYLDYKISNLCNLSCRTCNGVFSSKIENILEQTKIGTDHKKMPPHMAKERFDEFQWLIERGNPKQFYFASGEAFLQKEHWQLLEKAIENNKAKDITLSYTTNLFFPMSLLESKKEILEHFKSIEFTVSMDAEGKTNEFIRDGIKWEKFLENLNTIKGHPLIHFIGIETTLTLPLLLHFEDFLDFLEKNHPPYYFNFCVPGGYASLMSPFSLDKERLSILLSKCIDQTKKKTNQAYFSKVLSVLKEHERQNHLPREQFYLKESLQKELQFSMEIDTAFKRHSLKEFYLNDPFTHDWMSDILTFEEFDVPESMWKRFYKDLQGDFMTLEFPPSLNLEKIDSYEQNLISIIGSYPSFLGRKLSTENTSQKFKHYNELKNAPLPHWEKSFKRLGLFEFIFKNRKWSPLIGRFLDFLTIPLKPFTAIHFQYILKRKVPLEIKPKGHIYCSAPWTYSYLNADGSRQLCNFSKAVNFPIEASFEEYWNSDTLKDIRRKMMAGIAPEDICQACTKFPVTSDRPSKNFKISDIKEQILLKDTHETGHFEKLPEILDYRLSNQCNLGCRTCNTMFSSTIENTFKNAGINQSMKKMSSALQQKRIEEFNLLLKKGTPTNLYFASGESFLQKEHWELLENAVSLKKASNITLTYSTNLAFPLNILEKHEALLKEFKNVEFFVSVDGQGETGEFIRHGLNWQQFEESFKKIQNHSFIDFKGIDINLTLPLLLNMQGLLDFMKKYLPPYFVIFCEPGGYSSLMSPFCLPEKDLSPILYMAKDVCKSQGHLAYFSKLISVLNEHERQNKLPRNSFFALKTLQTEIRHSMDIDLAFKRKPIIDYYLEHPRTKGFFISLLGELPVERPNSIWTSYHGQGLTLEFPDDIAAPIFEKQKEISLIGSYPSFLSHKLNKDDSKKFHLFKNLQKNIPQDWSIEYRVLPPFRFLLREKRRLRILAGLLDILSYPLRNIIGLHYQAVLKKRD